MEKKDIVHDVHFMTFMLERDLLQAHCLLQTDLLCMCMSQADVLWSLLGGIPFTNFLVYLYNRTFPLLDLSQVGQHVKVSFRRTFNECVFPGLEFRVRPFAWLAFLPWIFRTVRGGFCKSDSFSVKLDAAILCTVLLLVRAFHGA